ncbi:hypothetical protein KP509_14G000800 [Ceratopteris richardii]|uniref:Sister chromatid cohesion protein n=1 Tax=Ceratopteris richardii TaxID=49495 RepID=A0A8T2T6Y0_CERRI|nr:hypothetical protein KP509_14G000800 [Ceratopteris richardii]
MYRLTNTAHTEVAPSLPLPSLSICFGAVCEDLLLFEERGSAEGAKAKARDGSLFTAHAAKIAELLAATDISYLSVRGDFLGDLRHILSNPDNLLAAVLRHNSEAFNFAKPEQNNQQPLQNFPQGKKEVLHLTANSDGLPEANLTKSAVKTATNAASDDPRVPTSTRKSRIRRKSYTDGTTLSSSLQNQSDSERTLATLSEYLEGLFEKMEPNDEDEGEGEDEGNFLPLSDMRILEEEIASAHAKNLLQLLSTDNLVKLLGLLDNHVKHAHGRSIDDDDESDSENYLVISSALEAAQSSLIIMTHPGMPKQVYKEEVIDRIVEFSRYQLLHSVFTMYDPLYRKLHKGVDVEDDIEDDEMDEDGASTTKKGRRKTKVQRIRRPTSNKISGPITNVLQKLCSILALIKDLLGIERLMDSSVLQLMKTVLAIFSVENLQLLQLKAIEVTCMIFSHYLQHRTTILDEILSLLWKFPSSKRYLRTYHLPDEESKQVQMLTALILQLVQCSASLPDSWDSITMNDGWDVNDGLIDAPKYIDPATEVSNNVSKGVDPAMEASTYFWTNVLQRWTMPKSHEGTDIRLLVENLVTDLLTTLNAPEFPAANVLLQVLCVLLFGSAGLKAKDASVRATAIELLGHIAARLKQDSTACNKETLWVFQEVQSSQVESEPVKDTCIVCGVGKGSKLLIPCDSCRKQFHGDCVGITGNDFLSRGWICHSCICKRQLTALEVLLKQKAADGKLRYKVKGVIEPIPPEKIVVPKEGMVILQQMLLNYLDEAASSDNLTLYARRFYLWQWYRDDSEGEENLAFYFGRCMRQSSNHTRGVVPTPFTRDVIVRICAVLGQQRPLARGFDRILERLLVSLQENAPTPRAKALRAVSEIVEVDPGVLGDERVQRAVEGRFLDSAISVREAAMELVGRHITSHPDVAVKYFEKIAERIMDTGVSVRKRVIKIIRDLCILKCDFGKMTDACVRIVSRINDDETSIQDLVCRTFFELWFEEPTDQQSYRNGDNSMVPSEITERVQQLVDVLKSLQNPQAMIIIIKRSLALDFIPQSAKNSATCLVSQATVRNRCEMMCKCLIENILKAEEGSSEDAELRALPYVLALHSFCMVDPTLCAPAADPSRYAVTLQSYLKTQVDNRDVAQLLQSIVFVIDAVLPLVRRPPANFVEELERDLRQLIVRYSFLTVVHACIKCLCSLGKIATKGLTSFEFLVQKFYKLLDTWRKSSYGAAEKPNVLRCLFCLGLLVRYGANLVEKMEDKEKTLEQLLSLYKHFLLSDDFDVKVRSLQALGFFFIAKPQLMMEKEIGKVVAATLSPYADSRIKLQSLRNFYDYLVDVEEKMGLEEKEDDVTNREAGAVPVAAGAGDSTNICGGIIQLHWDHILEQCLDINEHVRQAAVKVVEIVLRQGLVHPMTCVPHLIALEVDQYEMNAKLAHKLLIQMNEKYPSFFESRLGDGLQLSFKFIESGAASSSQQSNNLKIPSYSKSKLESNLALSAKSGISRTYKLIRGSRVSRNKFISSVVRKFDVATWGVSSIPFLMYCTEILASLPFTLPDEPLYLVFAINRMVQVRAGAIESNIKALIHEGPLRSVAKEVTECLAAERQHDSEKAYNLDVVEPQKVDESSYVDDTVGIPEEIVLKLKAECMAAVALALLLRLKRHTKILYNLSDARCQGFTPTEAMKAGETLSRQSLKDFSFKEIPTGSPNTIKQMLEQYQAFKRLMKEDTMDYSAYASTIVRKRNRSSVVPGLQPIQEAEIPEPVHVPTLRSTRRRSAAAPQKTGNAEDGDDSSDVDVDDDDYSDEDEDDGEYFRKGKRRKKSKGSVRLRARK